MSFPMAVPTPPPGKRGVAHPNLYKGVTKAIQKIKPDQCIVDLNVQRPRDSGRISRLAADWNDLAAGVVTVSRRTDGTIVILDGQTRFGALQVLGKGHETRDTIVYRGLSIEQEAEIFRILNNTKKLDILTLFHIACVEGNERSLAIRDMIMSHGWEVSRDKTKGLVAIKAASDAYDRDPATLDATLAMIRNTWGITRDSVNGTLLAGLSVILYRYTIPAVNVEHFRRKLLSEPQTDPISLVGRARTNRMIRSCGMVDAMADVLVNIYNKGGGKNKLAPWVPAEQ